jgi:flavin-dependent dehydrogenase
MEDGRANVCLVVERAFLKARRGCPDAAFEAVRRGAERAGDLLAGARFDSARPLAVGRLPYGFVRTRSDGAFHLGDQAAVIPSFCGEGMAIALASARLAADAILAGEEADIFQRRFARRVAARVKAAALLSRLICRGPVQPLLAATAPVAPPILARLATLTRIPADAKPAGAF